MTPSSSSFLSLQSESFSDANPLIDYLQKEDSEVVQSLDDLWDEFEAHGNRCANGDNLANLDVTVLQPSISPLELDESTPQAVQNTAEWLEGFLGEETDRNEDHRGETDVLEAPKSQFEDVPSVDQAEWQAMNDLRVLPYYDVPGSTNFSTDSPDLTTPVNMQAETQGHSVSGTTVATFSPATIERLLQEFLEDYPEQPISADNGSLGCINQGVSPVVDTPTSHYDAPAKQALVHKTPQVLEGYSTHGTLSTPQNPTPAHSFDQTSRLVLPGGCTSVAPAQLHKKETYQTTRAPVQPSTWNHLPVPQTHPGGLALNNHGHAASDRAVPPVVGTPAVQYNASQRQTFAHELPQFVEGSSRHGAFPNPQYFTSSSFYPTATVGWPGESSNIPPVQLHSTIHPTSQTSTWNRFPLAHPSTSQLPQPLYPQTSFPQASFPQASFSQPSFSQPSYSQPSYSQLSYSQLSYSQPPYSFLPPHPRRSNKRKERENDGLSSQRNHKTHRACIPSANQTGKTTEDVTSPKRHPAPYKLENGCYVCTYAGPAAKVSGMQCGQISSGRDQRARNRHLATHAAREEELIASNAITRDEAVALEWVSRIVVTCDKPECNFTTAVWRTDNVRRNHYLSCHPEDVPQRRPRRSRVRATLSGAEELFQHCSLSDAELAALIGLSGQATTVSGGIENAEGSTKLEDAEEESKPNLRPNEDSANGLGDERRVE